MKVRATTRRLIKLLEFTHMACHISFCLNVYRKTGLNKNVAPNLFSFLRFIYTCKLFSIVDAN